MNKKHWIGALVLCLLLVGAAWALGWLGGEDREVAALRAQMENQDQMSEEERNAFREQMRSLDDDQRRQLFEPMMQARQAEMQSRVYALLSMPKAQQRAELDKWIDGMEQRRSARGNRGGGPGRGGPNGGGDRPPRGEISEAQRAQRGKSRLDRSTPEMRATMTQMMKLVNQRREERGMEPVGRWR